MAAPCGRYRRIAVANCVPVNPPTRYALPADRDRAEVGERLAQGRRLGSRSGARVDSDDARHRHGVAAAEEIDRAVDSGGRGIVGRLGETADDAQAVRRAGEDRVERACSRCSRRAPSAGRAAARPRRPWRTTAGSEPIRVTFSRGFGLLVVVVVVGEEPPPPPQPAARTATPRSVASAGLATQGDLSDDAGSRRVRHPARVDRALFAVREPARAGEVLAARRS